MKRTNRLRRNTRRKTRKSRRRGGMKRSNRLPSRNVQSMLSDVDDIYKYASGPDRRNGIMNMVYLQVKAYKKEILTKLNELKRIGGRQNPIRRIMKDHPTFVKEGKDDHEETYFHEFEISTEAPWDFDSETDDDTDDDEPIKCHPIERALYETIIRTYDVDRGKITVKNAIEDKVGWFEDFISYLNGQIDIAKNGPVDRGPVKRRSKQTRKSSPTTNPRRSTRTRKSSTKTNM